jgi:ABC-type multidrug transport system ATPase subunit
MRIKKLEIKNFKFFDEVVPLEFESKNILLYGENGSGKSTIYWALYTLLQSSKKDDDKIKKYFTHSSDATPNNSSLVNIYAEENNSKIELFVDENRDKLIISKNEITIKDDTKLIEDSLHTSDFINYKYLFRFFNFLHQDKIDLFTLFEYEVLHLLQLDELWKTIVALEEGKPRVRADKTEYNNLIAKLDRFNEALSTKVSDLNEPTNRYLKKFDYDKIKILLTVVNGKYKQQTFDRPQINIELKVIKSNGDEEPILRPQSYFNEAKLTAIALSVRLAITQIKLKNSPLKLLVLDDLLISLDMSNRDKVLDILLNDTVLSEYQKIILTHDRSFFEMSKNKFNYIQKGEWKYLEMYVDNTGEFEKPFILSHRDYFEKAEYFFLKYDYSACANYLRKEAERLLKSLVCHHRDISCEETKNLQILIDKVKTKGSLREKENIVERVRELIKFEEFEKFIEIDFSKLPTEQIKKTIGIIRTELKRFKEFSNQEIEGLSETLIMLEEFKNLILNPQSHDDVKIPLYKKELEDAIKSIRKLREGI